MPTPKLILFFSMMLCTRLVAIGFDFSQCAKRAKALVEELEVAERLERDHRLEYIIQNEKDALQTARILSAYADEIRAETGKDKDAVRQELARRILQMWKTGTVEPLPPPKPKSNVSPEVRQKLEKEIEALYARRDSAPGRGNARPTLGLMAEAKADLLVDMTETRREKLTEAVEELCKAGERLLAVPENADRRVKDALEQRFDKALDRNLRFRVPKGDVTDSVVPTVRAQQRKAAREENKAAAEKLLGGWKLKELNEDRVAEILKVRLTSGRLAAYRFLFFQELAKEIPLGKKLSEVTPEEIARVQLNAGLALERNEVPMRNILMVEPLANTSAARAKIASAIERAEAFLDDPRLPPDLKTEVQKSIRFFKDFQMKPSFTFVALVDEIQAILPHATPRVVDEK